MWTPSEDVEAGLVFRLTQSLSKMMTVSAAVRLMPSPPALVLSRNRNTCGSLENLVICKGKKTQNPAVMQAHGQVSEETKMSAVWVLKLGQHQIKDKESGKTGDLRDEIWLE